MDNVHQLKNNVSQELDKIEVLNLLEKKTHVPKNYLAGAATAIIMLCLLFGIMVLKHKTKQNKK